MLVGLLEAVSVRRLPACWQFDPLTERRLQLFGYTWHMLAK